ncbi:MAG: AzlD domain-containing protein [Acidimicrobiia bacterium]|jgi:branched-subunit amino acid transport protein
MSTLLATIVVGIGTYLSRAVFILALAKKRIPDGVLLALQFVAPAVLASLVIALLINDDGSVALGAPELAGLAVGGGVAYRTRNHILTLLSGMVVFWVVRALI